MPRDCTVYHWNHCEQSRYVAGSHTNLNVSMTNGRVHGPKIEKVIINEVCAAARVIAPEIPPKVCKYVVKEAIRLGKKIPTPAAIASAAKEFMFSADNPFDEFGLFRRKTSPRMVSSTNSSGSSKLNSRTGSTPTPVALGGTSYAPVAISHNINRKSKPKVSYRGDAFVVSHSEMLGSILSGAPSSNVTAFRCFGMRANPGMATVFPWLSATAVNYEKYRFRRLSFTIVPLVSTGFSGRIGVGFDYDSSDTAPGTRQEFYALTNHAENMPWQGASINVKCDNQFRFTGTHVAADNKLIDQGQVILMSDSVSNGGTISAAIPLYDLIVDYEVELIEPQQALFSTQMYKSPVTGGSLGATGTVLAVGADQTVVTGPNIMTSVTVTSSTVVTIALPAGTYFFMIQGGWSAGTPALTVASSNATLRLLNAGGITTSGSINATSDCTLTATVSGVSWQANMQNFNLVASRCNAALANSF